MAKIWRMASFFLLIAPGSEAQLFSQDNKCDTSQQGISGQTIFKYADRRVCYFLVDGTSERANSYATGLAWDQNKKFNIATARQICYQQGSTLPISKSKEEEQHLMEN